MLETIKNFGVGLIEITKIFGPLLGLSTAFYFAAEGNQIAVMFLQCLLGACCLTLVIGGALFLGKEKRKGKDEW